MLSSKQVTLPKVFLSYSWEDDPHKRWVVMLATKLREDGVDALLDQWLTAPGDQLPEFMERAINENDYILIICTPKYKEKSEKRIGGVGYEGDIMTASILTQRNHRKFIPVLRKGDWASSAPSWLVGKYYIDLRDGQDFDHNYQDLLHTLLGRRVQPPPIGGGKISVVDDNLNTRVDKDIPYPAEAIFEPIKLIGIIEAEIGTPRNDGSRGSALYKIPFKLSQTPSREWDEVFIETWKHPPQFTTMHRPGIAKIFGDKLILDGTTIEEVEQYHLDTLKICLSRTNEIIADYEKRRINKAEQEMEQLKKHNTTVSEVTKRLKFD